MALPGPQTLLAAGWELLPRVPFVARQAAAAARGAHGQPHAAASAEDSLCGGRGSERTTRHYSSGRRDAAQSGLRRHRSNLAEGQAGGPRRSRRATGAGGAQRARSPGRAPERAKSAGALARACAVGRRRARYLPAPSRDAAGARLAAGEPGAVGKARGCFLPVFRALRTLKGVKKWPLV